MTALAWLIVVALGAMVLFVVAGVIDDRASRRPPARSGQQTAPAPPAPWTSGELYRARRARAVAAAERRIAAQRRAQEGRS